MPYVPGDNWVICDLTGRKVLMSHTRKTWDGLRVWSKVWYPKHPQLSIRGIPDRMVVIDGRSRPVDLHQYPAYGNGSWTLASPDGTVWSVMANDAGSLVSSKMSWQPAPSPLYLGSYLISISNAGTLSTTASTDTGPSVWVMISPNGTAYNITTPAGVITVVAA
jgi:hypothetical protein